MEQQVRDFLRLCRWHGLDEREEDWSTEAEFFCRGANLDTEEFISSVLAFLNADE